MLNWTAFERAAPQIAAAGIGLLRRSEVAFLATVSAAGRPRTHPFIPRVVEGRLVAFVMDSSPKIVDLKQRRQYSIHAQPGDEDEEFFVSGEALDVNANADLRAAATEAMGFATGVDEHHVLFEFSFDRALHTRWLDFGTASHRPEWHKWHL